MKNLLKIPILFTVLATSACRSHKTADVSNCSSNDSCVVQTDLNVHSITNVEKTESISSCLAKDHMEFSDGAGEILIHSNGEVSVKGLKSVYHTNYDTHKQSVITADINDSLTAKSHSKSTKATVSATKTTDTILATPSVLFKIILFMIIALLLIRIRRSR